MTLHLIVACTVAAYGATAVLVGARYWSSLPQPDIDRAVAAAQIRMGPARGVFAPVVAVLVRPAWALAHGLLWPLLLIPRRARKR